MLLKSGYGDQVEGKKLKIAVIVKNFNLFGGMERSAVELSQRLVKKGHQVDIYAREADVSLLGSMEFFPLSDLLSFSSVLSALELAVNVNKKIAGKKYDVVHSHERAYSQDLLTLHCFSYKGSLDKYSSFRYFDQKYLSIRSWIYLWLEGKQMQSDWLVAVSRAVKIDSNRYYCPKKDLFIIPPGVDTDYFNPAWISKNKKTIKHELNLGHANVVLFVGSEFKRKGLDYVIPAIGKNMHLLVVGQGDNINFYKKLAEKHSVSQQVTFVGYSDDTRKFYAAADLVILPSRSEAFGMTILEGMSCGIPVVTTANTGVSGVIKNGENGFVVDRGEDITSFCKEFFTTNPKSTIGDAARKTALKYSWQQITDEYENLYYQISQQKKN